MSGAVRLRYEMSVMVTVIAICGCKRSKSTDELLGRVESPIEYDRISAVRDLQHRTQDADKVVPILIKSLEDRDPHIRRSAAIGLGYFGSNAKSAIQALEKLKDDKDSRIREAAEVAIARINK